MKQLNKLAAIVILAMGTMPAAYAQMKDMDKKGMNTEKATGQAHKSTGKVTKIDSGKGTVTIAHEPVPSMKWPAMTMAFNVRDKAMLEKLAVGKKVEFEFVQEGRSYVVTGVR